jgi:galactose mutarotase-like enzyme
VVVFDEPDHAICLEPQTAPPDVFNREPFVVQPGDPLVATATWSWHLEKG